MLIWERKREGDEQTIKKLVKTGNEWGLQSSLQDSFASSVSFKSIQAYESKYGL